MSRDSKDPNDAPTSVELADAFFAAHERATETVKKKLSEMRAAGYRGFVDVGWFWPFAPLALHRSGKQQAGSSLRMTLYPVEEREAALPFGWVRYEVGDSGKFKIVGRG